MSKLGGDTIETQQYIYNDLYGSEYLKDKFSGKRNFTYFNYLLKMHNKFFTEQTTYKDIFGQLNSINANHNQNFSKPIAAKKSRSNKSVTPTPMMQKYQNPFKQSINQPKKISFKMDIEMINKHTFKLSRVSKQTKSLNPRQISNLNKTIYPRNPEEPGKNILKDKKNLQLAMQTYNKDRSKWKFGEEFKDMKQTMWNQRLKPQKSPLARKSFFIGNSKVLVHHQRNNSFA